MASNHPENPPNYEDVKPSSTTTGSHHHHTSQTGWNNIQNALDSSGITKVARRVTGAGDYFRHTILANVERLAGDAALADEKERLAMKGYEEMMRGRSEEHTHTPPIAEYSQRTHLHSHDNAPQTPMQGSTVEPGYVEPSHPVDSKV